MTTNDLHSRFNGRSMRQPFSPLNVCLDSISQAQREAVRAKVALGAPLPEQETIVVECACGHCRRPMTATITFHLNRTGDLTSHELFPATSQCPTCGLGLHARTLLYIPAGPEVPSPVRPDNAVNESNNQDTEIAREKGGGLYVKAHCLESDGRQACNATSTETAGGRDVRSPVVSLPRPAARAGTATGSGHTAHPLTIDDALLHLMQYYFLDFRRLFSARIWDRDRCKRHLTYSLSGDAFARFLRRAFPDASDRFLRRLIVRCRILARLTTTFAPASIRQKEQK